MMNKSAVAIAIGLAAFAAGLPLRGAAQNAGKPSLGEFSVSNFTVWDTTLGADTVTSNLQGPNLLVQSPQYDMAAPRIQMTVRRMGTPPRYRASKGTAAGGVRIVVRQPEAQRINTVTCDNAFYTAAAVPGTGRIDLRGNVRWVARDPALAEPSVLTGETGFIELLGRNRTRIVVNNGRFTATPIEPAPKKGGR
jgi:hypothetical protein